jgi:TM2 domain-containing membrane protein YozV
MKKFITAPLCSGLVIPGLGQILNQQITKGLILLGGVFVLFVAGVVKLALIIKSMTHALDLAEVPHLTQFSRGDLLFMRGLLAASAMVWVYSAGRFMASVRTVGWVKASEVYLIDEIESRLRWIHEFLSRKAFPPEWKLSSG